MAAARTLGLAMRRVLLVDDDPELLTARGDELAADGFEPILASSAPAARAKLPAAEAMILGALDTVPAALELLRDVRAGRVPGADPGVPILTLGADHDHQLIRHYQTGADIALPSGASPLLITAGVLALTARIDRQSSPDRRRLGNLELLLDNGIAMIAGEPLTLSSREFEVLRALARDPALVLSRHRLVKEVWPGSGPTRAPDTVIARLRDRLKVSGADVTVTSHRGRGWQLTGAREPVIQALQTAAFPAPASAARPPDDESVARSASPATPRPKRAPKR
jgi:DNA-binding response OmpR family regulator